MAKEIQIRCDLSGEYLDKAERQRIAVRSDEDRPEAAEYLDIGPCCFHRPISDLVAAARALHPVMADGQPS